MDARDIQVDLTAGTATLRANDMYMKDFHDFENAILGNGESPTPAVVSFTVEWTATGGVTQFENAGQRYRGNMRNATAQMEWTARSGVYEYTSAPLATSTTDAAQIGEERNGSFF